MFWVRELNPTNGQLVREPTILGVVLIGIGFAIVLVAAVGFVLFA